MIKIFQLLVSHFPNRLLALNLITGYRLPFNITSNVCNEVK